MNIRAAERGAYLWLGDSLDGVDHLLPRVRLLGAWVHGAPTWWRRRFGRR